MKNCALVILMALASASASASASAQATNFFTLNTRIEVRELHRSVTHATANCSLRVRDAGTGTEGAWAGTNQILRVDVAPTGSFNGPITVIWTERDLPSTDPRILVRVVGGHCVLGLDTVDGGHYAPNVTITTGAVTGHPPGVPFRHLTTFRF